MSHTYRLRSDRVIPQDGEKETTVYGIEAIDANKSIIISVPNIFLNESKAERLVELCNKHNLSVIHLMDVIEDALP